ncbi:MAG TPA: hypothetical protein VJY39_08535 [Acidisphaera sp.]|nr:hypothetical protein [Acidisphaera sp.]
MPPRDQAEQRIYLTVLDGPSPDMSGAVDVADRDGARDNAALTGELSRWRRLLTEAEAGRAAAEQERDALRRRLEQAAGQAAADAEAIRTAMRRRRETLRGRIEHELDRLSARAAEDECERSALQRELAALHASTCWRMTRPLRSFVDAMRGGSRRRGVSAARAP